MTAFRLLRYFFLVFLFVFSLFLPFSVYPFMSDSEIAVFQKEITNKPVGERIALWAERFVGAPYDPDPLGEYVTKEVIVADERVDCSLSERNRR